MSIEHKKNISECPVDLGDPVGAITDKERNHTMLIYSLIPKNGDNNILPSGITKEQKYLGSVNWVELKTIHIERRLQKNGYFEEIEIPAFFLLPIEHTSLVYKIREAKAELLNPILDFLVSQHVDFIIYAGNLERSYDFNSLITKVTPKKTNHILF